MVDWLYIKIAGGVDKVFAIEIEAKYVVLEVVLEVVLVDEVDEIDEFKEVDKYKKIVLS